MAFDKVTYISCNECGLEEISFEYERTLAQRVLFRNPTRKTFECWPTGWRHKSNGFYASATERADITMALRQAQVTPWGA